MRFSSSSSRFFDVFFVLLVEHYSENIDQAVVGHPALSSPSSTPQHTSTLVDKSRLETSFFQ
jgi:hypothetical protein